jgi:hypothetical protein
VPNDGFVFDGWYDGTDKLSGNATYDVTMNADMRFTAKFTPTGGGNTDPDTPGTVGNFTATPRDKQVDLSWEAPADDGGSAITAYEVTMDNWTTKATKTASQLSHTYPELTNGTEYTFKVRALNAKGAGAESTKTATPKEDDSGGDGGDTDIDDYVQRLIEYVGKVSVEGETVVKYKITNTIYEQVNLIVVEIYKDKPESCDVTMYEGWPDKYWYNYYYKNSNVYSDDQLAEMTWVDTHQCHWIFSENESTVDRLSFMSGEEWILVE